MLRQVLLYFCLPLTDRQKFQYPIKPGFHMILSNVRIVLVTEFLLTQSRRKDRTRFYRDDRFASDVRIVWNNRTTVSKWSSRSHDKTFCDKDDPYVRDECMETRFNRPDRLTKHSATETILMSEMSVWEPGLIVQIALQNILWQRRSLRLRWVYGNQV